MEDLPAETVLLSLLLPLFDGAGAARLVVDDVERLAGVLAVADGAAEAILPERAYLAEASPGDLGDGIGSRIARRDDERAEDKQRALRELLDIEDDEAVLQQSG